MVFWFRLSNYSLILDYFISEEFLFLRAILSFILWIIIFSGVLFSIFRYIWIHRKEDITSSHKLKIGALWLMIKLMILPAYGWDLIFHYDWKVLISWGLSGAYQTRVLQFDYLPGFAFIEYFWGSVLKFIAPHLFCDTGIVLASHWSFVLIRCCNFATDYIYFYALSKLFSVIKILKPSFHARARLFPSYNVFTFSFCLINVSFLTTDSLAGQFNMYFLGLLLLSISSLL